MDKATEDFLEKYRKGMLLVESKPGCGMSMDHTTWLAFHAFMGIRQYKPVLLSNNPPGDITRASRPQYNFHWERYEHLWAANRPREEREAKE